MANPDVGTRSMDNIRVGDSSIANQGNIGVLHHDRVKFHADPSASQTNYLANNQTNTHNYYGTPPPGTPPVQVYVRVGLPPRNANRVERKGLFEELEQMLRGEEHEPVALWGLPGSGKSQVALQYTHQRFSQKNCSVFWVHAKDDVTFVDGFRAISRKAGLPKCADDREMLLAVREWIENQPTWVMVIDGADDVKLFTRNSGDRVQLREFIPEGLNGTVIWTSQDRRILQAVGWTRGLKVGSMTPDEAVSLVEITANHGKPFKNAEATCQLVCHLGCHPLVVFHVAMSMRANCTPEEVLSRLADPSQRGGILQARRIDLGPTKGVPSSVLSTLTGQVERLASHYPDAYRLIAMIAYMDRHAIPLDIFLDVDGHKKDGSVRKAIARLKDLSLIIDKPADVEGSKLECSANGLMQEAIRQHLDQRKTPDGTSKVGRGRRRQANLSRHLCFWGQAITALSKRFPRTVNYDTLDLCSSLVEHVMKVSQWEPSEHKALVETADLLTRVGDYLLFCGRWLEMVTLYQRALQLRKSTFGTTDSRTIEAMERLAHAIMKLGNYQKALELFKKSRKNRIKTLGLPETHADVVTSDMNIGVAQRKLGQLSLAETLLTKALALRIKAFGDDHPDSAQGMYEMAQLYRAQGVRDKQTELLKKSLKIQGLHLGLKDPRTMETKLRLGSHLDLLGDGANAKKHLKEVFDLQCRLFGIRHPRTLEAKLRHGTAEYSSKENVYQALQVSSEVVAASTDTLGQTHPLTLRARGMRARYLFLVGRYANAASIQRNVLKSYSTKLGRTHCLSLSTQVSLADTLSSQGKMRDSKELATPAHDALCAQFGKDDARTIAAAKLLGRLADVPEKA